MTQTLRLHYAPDNASLCIRLALDALSIPYETCLVDRSKRAQKGPDFLVMNPNGLIPVLETPQGPLFETGAILLWLDEQSPGLLMPAPGDPARGPWLTWMIWLSNTLHPALRMVFYPKNYFPDAPDALRAQTQDRLVQMLDLLNTANPAFLSQSTATLPGCYLAPMLRWAGLFGGDTGWFDLSEFPNLDRFAKRFDTFAETQAVVLSEGLGDTPFSAPVMAQPPEGSAT